MKNYFPRSMILISILIISTDSIAQNQNKDIYANLFYGNIIQPFYDDTNPLPPPTGKFSYKIGTVIEKEIFNWADIKFGLFYESKKFQYSYFKAKSNYLLIPVELKFTLLRIGNSTIGVCPGHEVVILLAEKSDLCTFSSPIPNISLGFDYDYIFNKRLKATIRADARYSYRDQIFVACGSDYFSSSVPLTYAFCVGIGYLLNP